MMKRRAMISFARVEVRKDIEVLDTFFDDIGANAKPLDYLAKSIEFLAKADVAVFAPDWKDARGCRIEHQCAVDYGIPILEA